MGLKITKVDDGFVVSQNRVWVDGFFASEKAARMGAGVGPSALARIWKPIKAVGGSITERDLMGATA